MSPVPFTPFRSIPWGPTRARTQSSVLEATDSLARTQQRNAIRCGVADDATTAILRRLNAQMQGWINELKALLNEDPEAITPDRTCPNCHRSYLRWRGFRDGREYYECQDCGHWFNLPRGG